jgi:hypothetical protein
MPAKALLVCRIENGISVLKKVKKLKFGEI